jgi:hypothetical protein
MGVTTAAPWTTLVMSVETCCAGLQMSTNTIASLSQTIVSWTMSG